MEKELKDLWSDYLQGRMTLQDRIALGKQVRDPANRARIEDLIEEQFLLASEGVAPSGEQALRDSLEELLRKLPSAATSGASAVSTTSAATLLPVASEKKVVPFLRRWWAAAVLLALLITGAYWLLPVKQNASNGVMADRQLLPGQPGAVLTLSDGTEILLDSIEEGVVAQESGARASVVAGELVYEGHSNQRLYNTVTTPPGRQYRLVLPDGTKVWLNAASSIRFPTSFEKEYRKVSVTGEAYFEVSNNTRSPFQALVDRQVEIVVLGTRFNINAYADEGTIRTTLLEGAVRVSLMEDLPAETLHNAVTLGPGQQAVVSTGGRQTPGSKTGIAVVKEVDPDMVMAWKNGLFNFEGLTLDAAMRQLSRWYNIEVEYPYGVPDIILTGKMTRGVTLLDLLVVLEKLGVKYKLEGTRLVVLQ